MSRPPLGSTLDVFGMSIAWYSLLMMIAVVLGIILATREEKRLRLPKDTILNFALLAIPLGVIGARLYYVAFSWGQFVSRPLDILKVWNGGLALYGAVIGGLVAAVILSKASKVKIPFLSLLDACAPAMALGQAIGRWGNYANMEAYGTRITESAMQFFPLAVEIRFLGANGTEYWYWHMATFFFESCWCLIVFLILSAGKKKMPRRGDVVAWYLLLYSAGRTVIEGLRDDSLLFNVAGAQVRASQLLSALVCAGVVVAFSVRLLRRKKARLAEILCWTAATLGLSCTFISEFERNAYQDLFRIAQWLLVALAAVDLVFLAHYLLRTRHFGGPAVFAVLLIALCAVMLWQGGGRMGQGNVGFIALRQALAMAHLVGPGAWLYLRTK